MSLAHENILVKYILYNAKNSDEFFNELIRFLDKNKSKRELILAIFKRILIEESKKIYS